jgi:hypothetical protein
MTARRFENVAVVIGALTLLWTAVALAKTTAAEKCEAAKLNAAGKYGACRLGAEKKAVLKGTPPDYTKCDANYTKAWDKADSKYGVACPTSGDRAAIQTQTTQDAAAVTAELAGTPLCGNGAIDPEEQCDGSNLNGETCTTLGYSGGTLACNGSCQFNTASCTPAGLLQTGQKQCDQGGGTLGACPGYPPGQDAAFSKGVARQYVDNGDGTITDTKTGLMWEKLSYDGSIHDFGNAFNWYTAFTTKIAALNAGSGFAGHTDWRLPNVNELHSLADYGRFHPAIDPVFNTSCGVGCRVTTCSCTQSMLYWSSTTDQNLPTYAWFGDFVVGFVDFQYKSYSYYVRAVRGGS